MQTKIDNLNASVQENLIAIRVVKSFVRMGHEKLKFKKANDDLMKTSISATIRLSVMEPATRMVLYGTTLAIYWFGGKMVGNRSAPVRSAFELCHLHQQYSHERYDVLHGTYGHDPRPRLRQPRGGGC